MGNCCKPFAREDNREENPVEGLPMPSEGNRMETFLMLTEGDQSETISRHSETQAISTLPTHARNIENEREQDQDEHSDGDSSGRISMHGDTQAITTLPTHARIIENEREQDQDESLLMHSEGDSSGRISRDGDTQTITTLPTHARIIENEMEQDQDHESLLMPSEGDSSGRLLRHSDAQAISTLPSHARNMENEREQAQYDFRGYHPGFVGIDAELIAAGWPSWMVKDAGEAFMGWVPRKANSFLIVDTIGEGAYSTVYRAFDYEEGKLVALKKIKFNNLEPGTIRFMAREIAILRRLHHPNIIKLEGLVAAENSCNFYLVLEHMEYTLVGLAFILGRKFTEPRVKGFMKQLFSGLDYCHRQGILHRDIKSTNLLIDTNGNLKIADFGLANFYDPQQGCPLTNQVVTLWYRPPELLLGATCYGAGVDLWSAGCILGELYTGHPILRGRTEVDQLHKIFTLCGSPPEDYWSLLQLPGKDIFNCQKPFRRCIAEIFKDFPAPALALIETLLSLDPSARQSATHALNSEYFVTEPLPYEVKELPDGSLQTKSLGNSN